MALPSTARSTPCLTTYVQCLRPPLHQTSRSQMMSLSSTSKVESPFTSNWRESHTLVESKHLCYLTAKQATFGGCVCVLHQGDTDHPHIVQVVQTLVEPFHNNGYVDRYYTSPLFASWLSKVGITITGTVQSNRRGVPKEVTGKRAPWQYPSCSIRIRQEIG